MSNRLSHHSVLHINSKQKMKPFCQLQKIDNSKDQMWPREKENRRKFINSMVTVSKIGFILKHVRLDPEIKPIC